MTIRVQAQNIDSAMQRGINCCADDKLSYTIIVNVWEHCKSTTEPLRRCVKAACRRFDLGETPDLSIYI